jgi:hypothetical protein
MKNPSTWWLLSWLLALFTFFVRWFASGGKTAVNDSDEASPIPPMTPRLVEQYALAGGTDREIADRFLIDEETMRGAYGDVLRSNRALHNLNIRVKQYHAAVKDGNSTMLTWLGRNDLGQSTKPETPGEALPIEN